MMKETSTDCTTCRTDCRTDCVTACCDNAGCDIDSYDCHMLYSQRCSKEEEQEHYTCGVSLMR